MKEEIHPKYQKVAFKDSSTEEVYVIGSCMTSDKTITIDEIVYPLVTMDTTASSHPFYTGKQKHIQQEGRVARFNKKYGI